MKTIFLLGAVVVLAGLAYLLFTRQNQSPPVSENSAIETAEAPTLETTIPASPDTAALRAGGSSYLDPNGVFTFLYPADYTLDTQDPQHIRIYKQGEQQRPQSEMSNGVIMVFEVIQLENQSLSDFVDKRIQELTADGTSEVVQPKQVVSLNTYTGFSYKIRGLGVSDYVVVQKDAGSPYAVQVTYMVADPEQRNYQAEVEAVLATLEILK